MPRADNYHDQRLNTTTTPAITKPVPQVQPTPSIDTPTGTSPAELQRNLEASKEKAFNEYLLKQAGRSVASRLPYEVANTVFDAPQDPNKKFNVGAFDFPDEMEWQDMSMWDKYKSMQKGGLQLARRTLWSLPKTILQAPIKAGLTVAQAGEETVQAITGSRDKKNIIPDRVDLPVLGEMSGFRGTYEERREMGFSPFMAS